MNWNPGTHTLQMKNNQYATAEDLYSIFTENLGGLYQLSFLLTGNDELAERSFVTGFEESIRANQVFKEWAHCWAKRSIIQNAIHAVHPHPSDQNSTPVSSAFTKQASGPEGASRPFEIDNVLALAAFERFVFVLTVLEKYTDQDCAHLLSYPIQEIRKARFRAFEQIADLHREYFYHETAKNPQGANR
jgi:hypothetical protein